MAGIGFRIQKLLSEDNYTSLIKAYTVSLIVSAGPFLVTVIVISLLHIASAAYLTLTEQAYFRSLITYNFAFSLTAVGFTYLLITRRVADDYYRGRIENFSALYFSSLSVNFLAFGPLVLLYYWHLSLPLSIKINLVILFLLTVGIWLALIFLSAAQNYSAIAYGFFFGAVAIGGGSVLLGRLQWLPGYINGFVAGQAFIFFFLSWSILREFGYFEARDHTWLRYTGKYPYLIGIGALYNLGIWADKFLFWGSAYGETVDVRLRHCPLYDGPMFLAYLTVIPTFAYFLMQMETEFFSKYHTYYQSVQEQKSLPVLENARRAIIDSLEINIKRLLSVQVIISALAIVFAPQLAKLFRLEPIQMGILRVGILASFLQAGYLILLNIILYFDSQKDAFRSALLFFVLNTTLTWATLRLGIPFFGYGYALACLVAMGFSYTALSRRLKQLHYWTFMRQPIVQPVTTTAED